LNHKKYFFYYDLFWKKVGRFRKSGGVFVKSGGVLVKSGGVLTFDLAAYFLKSIVILLTILISSF
jgi:hypothetical protein